MVAAVLRDARDERLQVHVRDFGLADLQLAVDHLGPHRAVPPRLVLADVVLGLRVNLGEPLHVRDAVPAGDEQPERRALVLGQRLAVERPREERLGAQRLLARQRPAEVIVDLVLLRAPLDFFLAVIGAEEHHVLRLGLQPGGGEHGLQRHAGPLAVARQSLERAAVARAFEAGDQLRAAQLLQVVERERLGVVDQAGDLQLVGHRVDVGVAVVLGGREFVRRDERSVDGTNVQHAAIRRRVPPYVFGDVRELDGRVALREHRHRPVGEAHDAEPCHREATLQDCPPRGVYFHVCPFRC